LASTRRIFWFRSKRGLLPPGGSDSGRSRAGSYAIGSNQDRCHQQANDELERDEHCLEEGFIASGLSPEEVEDSIGTEKARDQLKQTGDDDDPGKLGETARDEIGHHAQ
jgi:hypothetical protein